MNTDVMFSSKTDLWSTPQVLFDELNDKYHFTLDVCADNLNHKCDKYYTEDDNALLQPWHGVCWMNPPYGREISKWIQRAFIMSRTGVTVVCLLPARTDTKWFHDFCFPYGEITFIKGRLKFGDAKNSAPFPSMIVVFKAQKLSLPILSTHDTVSSFNIIL